MLPSELYNWESQRTGGNSMRNELILALFIPCLVQGSSLICASAFADCTGSIHFIKREEESWKNGSEK